MTDEHPLRDRRVRGLVGLSGAVMIAIVAIFFLEGTIRWIVLGVGVLDAIVAPYILGKAVEKAETQEEDDEYGHSA